MLTATYSMVAMATEQARACTILNNTRAAITAMWANAQEGDLARIETALLHLTRFEHYCHQRKVEKFVIPAMRGASHEIDAIVGDLDSLSNVGMHCLNRAAEQWRTIVDRRAQRMAELCGAMELYCDCLQQRLRKEEEELLPLVRRMLSMDDWFALAAQFLGDERNAHRAAPPDGKADTAGP